MPLGIITDEELNSELGRWSPHVIESEVVTPDTPGRNKGDKNTPDSVRQVILDEGIAGEKNQALSEIFNVSPSSVSAYKKGATSTSNYNEEQPLKERARNRRTKLLRRAENKTNLALDNITSEKLSELSARENAAIARDMSAIIKNLTPEETTEDNRVQIVFYAPSVRNIEDFPIRQLHE